MFKEYDVIVVGAGHAGCEAAAAAANMGSSVLLVTMNMNTIAQMSCNPAMGGVAKGQIVREIDAMGGYSGIVADKSAIQFRMLNRSKGPAMWSPRTQNDRQMFANEWRLLLEQTENVDFWQEMVTGLIIEGEEAKGVITQMGIKIRSKAVILTNGTFLNGLIHIGDKNFGGGRSGERASTGITAQLIDLGFDQGRMKTGTPPRVDGRSLDYSKMEKQKGDESPQKFSFLDSSQALQKQRSCHISYTNPTVHEILEQGFERSPMFNGRIKSIGPRYCPSIEDKIHRFADKNRHQLFIEPEGWNTVEIYVNGFSTSLPEEVQFKALKQVKGFENVKFFRPGYAIEYDYFPPTQLNHTLETKLVKGLYFAGQINGTTGYEEAGCQGLIAGINAHQKSKEKEDFVLRRDQAYIGVLIDDLITKGTKEPYRMFTSRAEYRILLRQDNADLRLTPLSHELGLAGKERMDLVERKEKETEEIVSFFKKENIEPEVINDTLEEKGTNKIKQKNKAGKILSRPQITMNDLIQKVPEIKDFIKDKRADSIEEAEILMKYEGYIDREKENAQKLQRLENLQIPVKTDFWSISSLSNEAREKLTEAKPNTIAQASRISGITPNDISVLMVHLGR